MGPLAAVLAFAAALLSGVLAASPITTAVAALGLLIADELHERRADPGVLRTIVRLDAGPGWRSFYRQTLIVVLVLRLGVLSTTEQIILVAAVIGRHAALALFRTLSTYVGVRTMRRCETRNLGLPNDVLPPGPRPELVLYGPDVIVACDLLVVVALLVAASGGGYGLVAPAAVAAAVLGVLLSIPLLRYAVVLRRFPQDEKLLAAAQAAVRKLRPEVILHFSGGVDSVYQVNMWFRTFERIDRRVIVLLRERRYLPGLAPTSLPVLCLPFSVDLMNFEFPGSRIGLYVANVGKNIHLLREPHLKSAFIGHGDSDKTASFNPFSKVYDEIWVAGEAGRQRYLRADVGVRDEQIVLVGRPQLEGVEPVGSRPVGRPFSVLYAPTWEGWTLDLQQSSLVPMGVEIIRQLLAMDGVRVLFKPHPLTGTVDPVAGKVRDEIVAMLAAAGGGHRYVQAGTPLYDCFNESDALISDISSVVSDYLWSEKPYLVSNVSGVADDKFRRQNPSAGAAYLVGPGARGLAEGLAAARGADPMRQRREEVRTYLLGERRADILEPFRTAVAELICKAELRRPSGLDAPTEDDTMIAERAGAATGAPGTDG
jgi:hypothetical protein